jgi:hypothetical protein
MRRSPCTGRIRRLTKSQCRDHNAANKSDTTLAIWGECGRLDEMSAELALDTDRDLSEVIRIYEGLRDEYGILLREHNGEPLPEHPRHLEWHEEGGSAKLYHFPITSAEPLPLDDEELESLGRREELLSLRFPFYPANWRCDAAGGLHSRMNAWRSRLDDATNVLYRGDVWRAVKSVISVSNFQEQLPLLQPRNIGENEVIEEFDMHIAALKCVLSNSSIHLPSPAEPSTITKP